MGDEPFYLPLFLENHLDEYIEDRIEYALNLWFVFSILYCFYHSILMHTNQAFFGLTSMFLSMIFLLMYRYYQKNQEPVEQ